MPCLIMFGESQRLVLNPQQIETLLRRGQDAVITGFHFDCDNNFPGDVRLEDGWLKGDGSIAPLSERDRAQIFPGQPVTPSDGRRRSERTVTWPSR